MDFIKPMWFWFFWAILLHESVGQQMSTDTKTQIETGISTFKSTVDIIEKLVSEEKFIANIQKLSGYLGVVGALVSFVLSFFTAQESEELKFMKKKFSEVNMKLDRITQELDNVKDLIKLENQRAAYIKDASKILHGYKQLTQNYIPELASIKSCSTKRDCLRKKLRVSESYQNAFNVKSNLLAVLTGTMQSTSVFGDSLLDLIAKTYKCDINKVLTFANGVIKLAFKGQQVVLAHEKLTGTNMSIAQAMKDWSKMVYRLRQKADNIKISCYKNINKFITADVQNKKYQIDFSSNKKAAIKMKADLQKKYPWIYWTVIAYGAYGGQNHWGFSHFIYMPKNRNDRKRVFRVVAQDKGTYRNQRHELSSTLEKIIKKIGFPRDAHKVFDKMAKELQKTTVWKKLSAFIVLRDYSDFQVAIDNQHGLYHYNEKHTLCSTYGNPGARCNPPYKHTSRIWASLKSKQQIAGVSCTRSCSGHGRCVLLPYSSSSVCVCNPYYEGDNCQSYDNINLATSVDSMLKITARIPKITDVYFKLLDVQDFIGASLSGLIESVAALDAKLQVQYDNLNDKITSEFQWANLITRYSASLSALRLYLHLFQNLKSSQPNYEEKKIKFAKSVLHHEYIRKWVLDLNYLIVGRSGGLILRHKPLLFILMDMHKRKACSVNYKKALDNAWRQLIILQNQAYLMWAEARSIMNQPSDDVMTKYKTKVAEQEQFMASSTCELSILHSANLQCTGGFYIYPKLVLTNQCNQKTYVKGTSTTSCKTPQSSKCFCKNKYYGDKCSDRDCKWTGFGSYGSCSKSCDYGGQKTRRRSHAVTQKGNGRHCVGSSSDSTSCSFRGCCPSQYHCTANKKCIPGNYKCDYDNNCGNSQDEAGCSETCKYKLTPYSNLFMYNDAVILGRQRINCGGANNVIQSIQIERGFYRPKRFIYKCCKLFKSVCSRRKVTGESFIPQMGRGQSVSCGSYGVLNDFWISRNGDQLRYEYHCCDMNSKYRQRLSCYSPWSSYITRYKMNYVDADVKVIFCDRGYFLQYFRLDWTASFYWRYMHKCCRITE